MVPYVVDLPCYSRPAIQDNFRRRIMEICKQQWKPSDKDMEIIKILAPLIDNSNAHKYTWKYSNLLGSIL